MASFDISPNIEIRATLRLVGDVFKALADPTRREILRLLRTRPLTAGELADRFPQAKSTLSAHFNVLKAADLVKTERAGQTITYSLNASVFEDTLSTLLDLFHQPRRRKT